MTLNLTGEVNEEMYNKVFAMYAKLMSGEVVAETLDIFVNSGGGDVDQGLAIYDLIQLMRTKTEVRTIATGLVASAGITVYLAGVSRFATPYATFMIHYGETSCSGYSEMGFNKKMLDLHINLMYDKLTVTKKTLKRWHDGDHYFFVDKAIEIGLVEYII